MSTGLKSILGFIILICMLMAYNLEMFVPKNIDIDKAYYLLTMFGWVVALYIIYRSIEIKDHIGKLIFSLLFFFSILNLFLELYNQATQKQPWIYIASILYSIHEIKKYKKSKLKNNGR